MPKQDVVNCICLDVHILLEKLDIYLSACITHAQSYGHILQHLKLEITWILIVLNFERDNVLSLFLWVEDIDGKRQILFIFAGIPVSECIEPCLSRHLIFALDDLLLVPGLFVQLWMHFEHQALEILVAELDLWGALFRVGQSHVEHTFQFKFLDVSIFGDAASNSLINFHQHVFS